MNFKHDLLNKDFVKISNNLIQSKELNPVEKLIYFYISSKPRDWDFSNNKIANDIGISRNTTRRHLQSLEDKKILKRESQKDSRRYYYRLIKNFDEMENDEK